MILSLDEKLKCIKNLSSFYSLIFLARYRRKLRSKFDTVKKQFSDQHPSSSTRFFHHSHVLTFDDIGNLFIRYNNRFFSSLKYFNRFRIKSIIA